MSGSLCEPEKLLGVAALQYGHLGSGSFLNLRVDAVANLKTHMRPSDAGTYLGLSVSTLSKMRMRGDGPSYSKAGPRLVTYLREDLDAWLAATKRVSTSKCVAK